MDQVQGVGASRDPRARGTQLQMFLFFYYLCISLTSYNPHHNSLFMYACILTYIDIYALFIFIYLDQVQGVGASRDPLTRGTQLQMFLF